MRSRLTAVGEEEVPELPVQPPPQALADAQQRAAFAGLMIALKALSQRTIVAIAALFDLALIASAFALWWQIIDEPTMLRIASAGTYSMFIASVLLMRRR